MQNNAINADILQKELGRDIEVIYYQKIDSTNTQARRLINKGKKNALLIVSNEQTDGRGRQGKSFYSPAETGIYMSLVFAAKKSLENAVASTTAAAVAVCKAIEAQTDLKPEIKWVNDIYLSGKKICGILCEAVSDIETQKINCVIIGIGLNIKTTEFPENILNASCLDRDVERTKMIAEIAKQLREIVSEDYGDFIDYYREHSCVLDKDIVFIQNSKETHAKALEIDETGGLIVQLENGEIKTLRSGEISIRV